MATRACTTLCATASSGPGSHLDLSRRQPRTPKSWQARHQWRVRQRMAAAAGLPLGAAFKTLGPPNVRACAGHAWKASSPGHRGMPRPPGRTGVAVSCIGEHGGKSTNPSGGIKHQWSPSSWHVWHYRHCHRHLLHLTSQPLGARAMLAEGIASRRRQASGTRAAKRPCLKPRDRRGLPRRLGRKARRDAFSPRGHLQSRTGYRSAAAGADALLASARANELERFFA